jgi:hypothetical protein
MIIDNHIGNPIDNVIIRCLDEDSEYGIIPIKLIIIIVINRVVTSDDIPFKLNDIVRDSCVIITSIIGKLIEFFR